MALPGHLGGLSLSDPVAQADVEYNASTQLTTPLVALIVVRKRSPGECFERQKLIKTEIRRFKHKLQDDKAKALMEILPDDLKRCVHLAQEKRGIELADSKAATGTRLYFAQIRVP